MAGIIMSFAIAKVRGTAAKLLYTIIRAVPLVVPVT